METVKLGAVETLEDIDGGSSGNPDAFPPSDSKLDGPTIFCALLWLAAIIIFTSIVIRKIRLYVYAYRRKQYLEQYLHLCHQQYNQRYNQQYNEKSGEIPSRVFRDTYGNVKVLDEEQRNIYHDIEQGNRSDKSCHFVGLYGEVTGKELYTEKDTRGDFKAYIDEQANTQVHRQDNIKSDMKSAPQTYKQQDKAKHQPQQQLDWQHQRDLILLQRAEDLLLGGSFYSYMSMPRMLLEDADLL